MDSGTATGGLGAVEAAEIRGLLQAHGLRYSRPRASILQYFRERARHVSAETLYRDLRERDERLSLSTVYLNLTVLCEAGLVQEIARPGGGSLYDSNVSPHYHIVCRTTGELLDLPPLQVGDVPLGRYLKETIERVTGWQVEEPKLSFVGRSPAADLVGDDDGP